MSLLLNGTSATGRQAIQLNQKSKVVETTGRTTTSATDPGSVTVKLNSAVEYKYLDEDQVTEILIVMPDNADVRRRRLSVFAPISVALLGRNRGDNVEFRTANGTRTVKILNVINR